MDSTCEKICWSDFNRELQSNSLSILCMNARSLKSKFQELVSHLNIIKNNFSFIVITESCYKATKMKFVLN